MDHVIIEVLPIFTAEPPKGLPKPIARKWTTPKKAPQLVDAEPGAPVKPMKTLSRTAPNAIDAMTEAELIQEFTRTTGLETLTCKHCHSEKVPLERMSTGIRNSARKTGFVGMRIPKTCNTQLARNAISNPITNRYAALIKKAASEADRQELLQKQRAEVAAARVANMVPSST
jgi:hypothetical protein